MASVFAYRLWSISSLAAVFLSLVSAVTAGGWRYPYESCQWTVQATAVETWFTTETDWTRVAEAGAAVFPGSGWDPVSDVTVRRRAPRQGRARWNVHLEISDETVQDRDLALVQMSIGSEDIHYEIPGDPPGHPPVIVLDEAGETQVTTGTLITIHCRAEHWRQDLGGAGAGATVDVLVRTYVVEHRTTITATSGPHFGSISQPEGIKSLGAFPLQIIPQHGGTLSPTSYSLINVAPPVHGSIWLDSTSTTVFAQTSYRIRTWDLLVLPEKPGLGAAVGVLPEDNNHATTGTTPLLRVFDAGTTVVLTASAWAECRRFDHWEDAATSTVSTSPTLTAAMNGDQTYYVAYAPTLSAPVLAPEPPFSLGTSNQLNWSAVGGAQAYLLEWSSSSSFGGGRADSGWRPGTVFRVTGLQDGVTYYYRVRCRNVPQEVGPWSNVVSSRQDAFPPTAPGIPQAGGPFTSSTTVRFRWTPATDSGSGVVNYGMYVGTTPGGHDVVNGMVGNVLERTVYGRHGQTLYARVYARDGVGFNGPWSGVSPGVTVDTVRPRLAGVRALNRVTLDVVFDEPVRRADLAASYLCSGGLGIVRVAKVSETTYLLSTTAQQGGRAYTLTVRGTVSDRAGNPMDPSFSSRSFVGTSQRLGVRDWRSYR